MTRYIYPRFYLANMHDIPSSSQNYRATKDVATANIKLKDNPACGDGMQASVQKSKDVATADVKMAACNTSESSIQESKDVATTDVN